MEKGKSQSKANKGLQRFVSGGTYVVLVAPILLSIIVFNHLRKKKKSVDKESTKGVSTPLSVPTMPIGEGSDQYDVFLSFKGSDTRKEFTDHLYHSLVKVGTKIHVFKDDKSLKIGEDFDSEILDAITLSKISIPIISENYASSKWCLRELVHMMECKKSMSHIVMPIFYKVDPSDVRYLKGNFGRAFHSCGKHFDKKDIQEWKQALTEVSNLNGWESENFAKGHKGELVEEVIKTILSKLRHNFQLDVPELVGVDYHVNKIMKWVGTPPNHAQMIGIYGMGGIGKTTLAKVIYNRLLNKFTHRSFLPDIRDTAHRNGFPYLQSLLINQIQPKGDQVRIVDDGISLIKSRLKGKKVLILLDDIDHQDQLNALARERDWFKTGSIIIVTTRYKAVLDQSKFQVDYEYKLDELDEVHSLILFKRHAFRIGHCSGHFEPISHDILSTMGGLPLAIQVIGSHLYGKTDMTIWQDMLEKLRNQPDKDVQKILKISYDALEPGQQKIFLDIACFFIGEDSKYAMYMWKDCKFYPNEGIDELKLRCLIKIEANGKFGMHDQLRDLGRSIVCQGQSLERHSRLWEGNEAFEVLMEEKGTEEIHAMRLLPTPPMVDGYTYTNKQFNNLRNLRYLTLCNAALSGDFNNLFSQLRWFVWNYRPTLEPSFSTFNLRLSKLVVMEMYSSPCTEDWGGWRSIMTAKQLKVLDLRNCNLRCTPDLSAFVKLEILILNECLELKQIHPSIGKLKALISLKLRDCSLEELPKEVGELKELKQLHLEFLGVITKIPTSIGSMRNLEKLKVKGCVSLNGIPSSFGDLQNLQHLHIWDSPDEIFHGVIGRLKKLQSLNLQCCNGEIPLEISELSSLRFLRLCGSPMIIGRPRVLPSALTSPNLPWLSCLIHLKELDLSNFENLEYILELPSRLSRLVIDQCGSIQKLFLPKWLKELKVKFCNNLIEIKVPDDSNSLEEISISYCTSIQMLTLPKLQHLNRLKAKCCDNLVEIRNLDQAEFLQVLDICGCKSIERLPDLPCTLKELKINWCPCLLEVESLERFLSCRSIYVIGCSNLEKLPNLSKFENLEDFTIVDSLQLAEIPGIGGSKSLREISIAGCKSLEILPDLSGCEKLQHLEIARCEKLTRLEGLEELDLAELIIYGCCSLEIPELPQTRVKKYDSGGGYVYLEGRNKIRLQ